MQLPEASVDNTLLNLHNSSDGSCSSYLEEKSPMVRFPDPKKYRGVARGVLGWPWPPLVGLLLSKQTTIFSWRKRHDNILAIKDAIVEKPTFLKFVFLKSIFINSTLGARDFSSAVSGFWFPVSVASAFGQHRKFPPHARKTSGTQGTSTALFFS